MRIDRRKKRFECNTCVRFVFCFTTFPLNLCTDEYRFRILIYYDQYKGHEVSTYRRTFFTNGMSNGRKTRRTIRIRVSIFPGNKMERQIDYCNLQTCLSIGTNFGNGSNTYSRLSILSNSRLFEINVRSLEMLAVIANKNQRVQVLCGGG